MNNWPENSYGTRRVYETDDYVTYGGGPEGGYVYLYREREPSWYYWKRGLFGKPTYMKLNTWQIVSKICDEGRELIARVPNSSEYEPMDGEVIINAADDKTQRIAETRLTFN